jgi:hypothetical protein
MGFPVCVGRALIANGGHSGAHADVMQERGMALLARQAAAGASHKESARHKKAPDDAGAFVRSS